MRKLFVQGVIQHKSVVGRTVPCMSARRHGSSAKLGHDEDCTERTNNATRAQFTLEHLENPFAEGAFRWVAHGVYTKGERRGQKCVCKWFKSGQVYEEAFFAHDIQAVDKALEIISRWNSLGIINKRIRLHKPEVWTFEPDSSGSWAGRKVLQEPFVENWEKFNSNSGWNRDKTPWPRIMQALSHFSYHVTGGRQVLCDLQGGVYRDGVVLSDPVVLSRDRTYGVTDLGPTGISTFFSQHTCNEFCRDEWSMPRDRQVYHRIQAGTSMAIWAAPTHRSRPPMTGLGRTTEDRRYYYYGSDSDDDIEDDDD